MMDDVKDYPPYLDYPKERKKQTNADKIRQMSDEELARFLERVRKRWVDPVNREECSNCLGEDCPDCWLDWLKQEVESDA